ncbi:MAG: peptide chain release factor N(5)-glutamine methyltransferase [Patescibacteria group bacterium]
MSDNLDLDLLRAHSTLKNREFLYTHPEYKPNFWQRLKFRYFLFKYHRGYAVATITKHKEFFGLDFYVDKNVLIPRPETELLVENAIDKCRKNPGAVLIDVGTGSGCIPISILKSIAPANTKVYAIDISKSALRVAKINAIQHGVKINFMHSDLLKSLPDFDQSHRLIITANLPYLTREQFNREPSIKKEPKIALIADNTNGLAIYENLLRQIRQLKNHITVFLEIDPAQADKIPELIKKYLPQAEFEIKKDLSGLDRTVIIKN